MKSQKIILKEDQLMKPCTQESFNLKQFAKNLKIIIESNSDERMAFEMIGVDAPVANALRRIMIAEIPTMAIHKVQVIQNTSVIPDEVLAHRLGLVPIIADPLKFIEKEEHDDYNQRNCIIFNLNVKCEKQTKASRDDPIDKQYTNTTVYSSALQWEPIGNQRELFKEGIKPVYDNIIIAKLRENQELQLRLICHKGIGKQHAKWSPVCTAFYKLMPSVEVKDVSGENARKLKDLCPMGVFGLRGEQAVVKNAKACTSCRECIREAHGLSKNVEIGKIEGHYLFTIESVGQYKAQEIMFQAIDILRQKAKLYIKE